MTDYLAGLNNMTESMGNEDTATQEFQGGTGQKGLDYSGLGYDVVEFVPAGHGKENRFDIIPFIISAEWYPRLLFPPPTQQQKEAGQKYARLRGRDVGQADIALEIPFHRFADGDSGDAVCIREAFGDKCPHCELMFELYRQNREEGNSEAKEQAKEFGVSWRTFMNIFNYNHQNNPNAPEDHDGYEIINDMGRGALMKYIQKCSKDTELGENFVYAYGDPTENGYTLVADSNYEEPTSKKFNKGYTKFPIVKFKKRDSGVDYTIKGEDGLDDIQQSVGFDALVTPLIYTYEEMAEMVEKKKTKIGLVIEEKEEEYNTDQTDQSNSSYAGTPEGNGIGDIPQQEVGTDNNGEKIDDSNSYDQSASTGRRGRPGRRDRNAGSTSSSTGTEEKKEEEAPASTGRRRRR